MRAELVWPLLIVALPLAFVTVDRAGTAADEWAGLNLAAIIGVGRLRRQNLLGPFIGVSA